MTDRLLTDEEKDPYWYDHGFDDYGWRIDEALKAQDAKTRKLVNQEWQERTKAKAEYYLHKIDNPEISLAERIDYLTRRTALLELLEAI